MDMNMMEKPFYIQKIFQESFGFWQFLTALNALYLLVLKKLLVAENDSIPKEDIYHIPN